MRRKDSSLPRRDSLENPQPSFASCWKYVEGISASVVRRTGACLLVSTLFGCHLHRGPRACLRKKVNGVRPGHLQLADLVRARKRVEASLDAAEKSLCATPY